MRTYAPVPPSVILISRLDHSQIDDNDETGEHASTTAPTTTTPSDSGRHHHLSSSSGGARVPRSSPTRNHPEASDRSAASPAASGRGDCPTDVRTALQESKQSSSEEGLGAQRGRGTGSSNNTSGGVGPQNELRLVRPASSAESSTMEDHHHADSSTTTAGLSSTTGHHDDKFAHVAFAASISLSPDEVAQDCATADETAASGDPRHSPRMRELMGILADADNIIKSGHNHPAHQVSPAAAAPEGDTSSASSTSAGGPTPLSIEGRADASASSVNHDHSTEHISANQTQIIDDDDEPSSPDTIEVADASPPGQPDEPSSTFPPPGQSSDQSDSTSHRDGSSPDYYNDRTAAMLQPSASSQSTGAPKPPDMLPPSSSSAASQLPTTTPQAVPTTVSAPKKDQPWPFEEDYEEFPVIEDDSSPSDVDGNDGPPQDSGDEADLSCTDGAVSLYEVSREGSPQLDYEEGCEANNVESQLGTDALHARIHNAWQFDEPWLNATASHRSSSPSQSRPQLQPEHLHPLPPSSSPSKPSPVSPSSSHCSSSPQSPGSGLEVIRYGSDHASPDDGGESSSDDDLDNVRTSLLREGPLSVSIVNLASTTPLLEDPDSALMEEEGVPTAPNPSPVKTVHFQGDPPSRPQRSTIVDAADEHGAAAVGEKNAPSPSSAPRAAPDSVEEHLRLLGISQQQQRNSNSSAPTVVDHRPTIKDDDADSDTTAATHLPATRTTTQHHGGHGKSMARSRLSRNSSGLDHSTKQSQTGHNARNSITMSEGAGHRRAKYCNDNQALVEFVQRPTIAYWDVNVRFIYECDTYGHYQFALGYRLSDDEFEDSDDAPENDAGNNSCNVTAASTRLPSPSSSSVGTVPSRSGPEAAEDQGTASIPLSTTPIVHSACRQGDRHEGAATGHATAPASIATSVVDDEDRPRWSLRETPARLQRTSSTAHRHPPRVVASIAPVYYEEQDQSTSAAATAMSESGEDHEGVERTGGPVSSRFEANNCKRRRVSARPCPSRRPSAPGRRTWSDTASSSSAASVAVAAEASTGQRSRSTSTRGGRPRNANVAQPRDARQGSSCCPCDEILQLLTPELIARFRAILDNHLRATQQQSTRIAPPSVQRPASSAQPAQEVFATLSTTTANPSGPSPGRPTIASSALPPTMATVVSNNSSGSFRSDHKQTGGNSPSPRASAATATPSPSHRHRYSLRSQKRRREEGHAHSPSSTTDSESSGCHARKRR